jgi:putative colanic acid biosynthesis acetyltransferase WcaF
VRISAQATHDHTKSDFPLLRPQIPIGTDPRIYADAFVGPGVTVDEGAIIEAGRSC